MTQEMHDCFFKGGLVCAHSLKKANAPECVLLSYEFVHDCPHMEYKERRADEGEVETTKAPLISDGDLNNDRDSKPYSKYRACSECRRSEGEVIFQQRSQATFAIIGSGDDISAFGCKNS
jgi:hypothetical protein